MLKNVLVLVFLSIIKLTSAQYPLLYKHLRYQPTEKDIWEKALNYYKNNNADSAVFFIDSLKNIYAKQNNWPGYTFLGEFKSKTLGDNNRMPEAIFNMEQTINFVQNKIDTTNIEYISILRFAANAYYFIGKPQLTLEYYNRAINLLIINGKYPSVLANTYLFAAMHLERFNSHALASNYYNNALEAVKNRPGNYNMATYYFIIASRLDVVQIDSRIEMYKAVIYYCEKGGFTNSHIYFESLQKLGINYSNYLNDTETALTYFKLAEQNAFDKKYHDTKIYDLYIRLGDLYRLSGNLQLAENYFVKAHKIITAAYGASSLMQLSANMYLGQLYRDTKNFEQAKLCYDSFENIAQKKWGINYPLKDKYLYSLGHLYYEWQKYDSALYYLQQSLFFAEKTKFESIHQVPVITNFEKFDLTYTLIELKILSYYNLYKQNANPQILNYGLNHCNLLDSLLNAFNNKSLTVFAGMQNSKRYQTLADISSHFALTKFNITNDSTYLYKSLDFFEKASANYLNYLISTKNNSSNAFYQLEYRSKINQIESKFKNTTHFNDSVFYYKSKLINEFKTNDNNNLNTIKQYNIYDIQNNIDSNSVLLYYKFINNNNNLIVFALSNKLIKHNIYNADTILNCLDSFTRDIKTGNKYLPNKINTTLYNYLLRPFIKPGCNITIIANGNLQKLPFECIFSDSINMLINQNTITYHYSLRLWYQSKINTPTQNGQFVLTITPYNNNNNVTNQLSLRNLCPDIEFENLTSLPFANQEVTDINKLLEKHGKKYISLTGANATKQNFIKNLHKPNIVHIATHGFASNTNINNSGLFFYKNASDSLLQNILFTNELYNLNTNANLVVLSACKTGSGKIIEGEGVMALPRGFIYAGVPNVIASLWKVNDQHTKELMVAFYKHLLANNISYAQALRLAKIDCINKGFLPVDWAGFILLGN